MVQKDNLLMRWLSLTQRLHATTGSRTAFRNIAHGYQKSTLHYHTLDHVAHVLRELDTALQETKGVIARNPDAIEYALWLHDAIYCPGLHTNEEESAWLARITASNLGLSLSFGEYASALVLATKHDKAPTHPDAMLTADCDLAILGATPQVFDDYDAKITAEYAAVYSPNVLRKRRGEFMARLLERPIFHTEYFIEKYGDQAGENIKRLIARLS